MNKEFKYSLQHTYEIIYPLQFNIVLKGISWLLLVISLLITPSYSYAKTITININISAPTTSKNKTLTCDPYPYLLDKGDQIALEIYNNTNDIQVIRFHTNYFYTGNIMPNFSTRNLSSNRIDTEKISFLPARKGNQPQVVFSVLKNHTKVNLYCTVDLSGQGIVILE